MLFDTNGRYEMKMANYAMALLALTPIGMRAQLGATPDQTYHQTPDKDGVYFVGPEVTSPTQIHAEPAAYSNETERSAVKGISVWSMVIRADGTPADTHLIQPLGAIFDSAAIEAINQSEFEPGKLRGVPVAVRIAVAVPFHYGKYPSNPFNCAIERDLDPNDDARNLTNCGPRLIHTVSASLSSDAIRAKYQGIVLVSALVGEDGLPSDVHVTRALGMGFDERAIEAVKRYRFRPAMKSGRPIAAKINLEVNCLLY
jgi:TonB family protein